MKNDLKAILCLLFLNFAQMNFAQANQIFFDEIAKMREKNILLSARSAQLEAIHDNAISKKLFWVPTLSLSAGTQKTVQVPSYFEAKASSYWKASSAWNLFKGGADFYSKQTSEFQERGQNYNYQNESLLIDTQLASIIFQQLYLNDVIKSTENLLKLRENFHRIVLEKYKTGKLPFQEVEKSDIDKNQQENRLRNLQIENLENKTQWRALFGEDMKTQNWPFLTNQHISGILANEVDLGSNNLVPELAKLENLSLASENNWKSAKSDYWPQFDFALEYQAGLDKDNTNKVWSGGVFLTIPLWTKYETAAKVSASFAEYMNAKSQFEAAKNLNKAKKDNLDQKIQLTRKNLDSAKINLEKSEKLYEDMLKSFSFGRISMNELLIEQNRLIDSQMGLSQSEWDYHKALLEACNILGKTLETCLSF
jgi:outer membrane protein TolC